MELGDPTPLRCSWDPDAVHTCTGFLKLGDTGPAGGQSCDTVLVGHQ